MSRPDERQLTPLPPSTCGEPNNFDYSKNPLIRDHDVTSTQRGRMDSQAKFSRLPNNKNPTGFSTEENQTYPIPQRPNPLDRPDPASHSLPHDSWPVLADSPTSVGTQRPLVMAQANNYVNGPTSQDPLPPTNNPKASGTEDVFPPAPMTSLENNAAVTAGNLDEYDEDESEGQDLEDDETFRHHRTKGIFNAAQWLEDNRGRGTRRAQASLVKFCFGITGRKEDPQYLSGSTFTLVIHATVNPTYTCFDPYRNPEMCPVGALALHMHFVHDTLMLEDFLNIDYTAIRAGATSVQLLHGPSPTVPYNESVTNIADCLAVNDERVASSSLRSSSPPGDILLPSCCPTRRALNQLSSLTPAKTIVLGGDSPCNGPDAKDLQSEYEELLLPLDWQRKTVLASSFSEDSDPDDGLAPSPFSSPEPNTPGNVDEEQRTRPLYFSSPPQSNLPEYQQLDEYPSHHLYHNSPRG
ncbi:hypothetical protein CPB83DRAFT_900537 [Crepidotus variabilis]|uniref:Uncharacterized protein n=1 Tax=Crepidotus variabilis TaxID=179855 RepID=A0A9P6E312_9AGAR|nr:hypothetical protein CPB83DRAFT_900537 [Crepidotus variabilis]